jgi:hypothetical protein
MSNTGLVKQVWQVTVYYLRLPPWFTQAEHASSPELTMETVSQFLDMGHHQITGASDSLGYHTKCKLRCDSLARLMIYVSI